jgi:superfamily II RNA helicase
VHTQVFAVVFDEFHYMNDPDRGTVWEESVILSPPHILFVALSATIANVDQVRLCDGVWSTRLRGKASSPCPFLYLLHKQVAGWIGSVHGPTKMVVSDFRPVPLKYHFLDNEGMCVSHHALALSHVTAEQRQH